MRRLTFALAAALTVIAAGALHATGMAVKPVSLVALLATPERYDGMRVQVVGYAPAGHDALYLSAEDARVANVRNGVFLARSALAPAGGAPGYVLVEGTFRPVVPLFSGQIESITRLERWTDPTTSPPAEGGGGSSSY